MVVRNGCQGSRDGGTHEGTDTVGQCAHNAVGRTGDDRVGERILSIHDSGRGLCYRSLRLCIGVGGRLQVEVADHLLSMQVLCAFHRELCRCLGSLRGFEVGCRCVQCCLIGNLINDEQGLALAHMLTFSDA